MKRDDAIRTFIRNISATDEWIVRYRELSNRCINQHTGVVVYDGLQLALKDSIEHCVWRACGFRIWAEMQELLYAGK